MNEADQLGTWLDQNAAQQDTPEFKRNLEHFRVLRAQEKEFPPPDPGLNALPNAAAETFKDPGGFGSTMARVTRMGLTGIPDLLISMGNAAVREANSRGIPLGAGVSGPVTEQPTVGELWDKQSGVPAAPPGDTRAILEGVGAGLVGGGFPNLMSAATSSPSAISGIINALSSMTRNVVTPTVGSHYGAQFGEKAAPLVGLDPRTGGLIGGLAGGTGASVLPGAYDIARHNAMAARANPQAQNLVSDARALMAGNDLANAPQGTYGPPPPRPLTELPLSAGQLGDDTVRIQEQRYGASGGGAAVTNAARQRTPNLVNQSMDRITAERGATDIAPDKASIGQGVKDIAAETSTGLQQRSAYEQQQIRDQMPDASIPARPLVEEAYRAMPAEEMGGRRALGDRVMDEIAPLAIPDPVTGETRIPIAPFMRMRSKLGQDIDAARGGGMARATPQLYGPATDLFRSEAERYGVPAAQFDATMSRNRDVMRPPDPRVPGDVGGDVPRFNEIAGKEPGAAFSWLTGGGENPARLQFLESSGHPQVPSTFGDLLRMIQQKTIGTPSSQGPVQFSRAVSAPAMSPEALETIAGPYTSQVQAAGRLANSSVYPSNQMRLGRAMEQGSSGVGKTITSSEIGGALGGLLDSLAPTGLLPPGTLSAGGRIGGVAIQNPIARYQAEKLQGPCDHQCPGRRGSAARHIAA